VYDYSSAGYTVPVVNVNTTGTITGKIKVSDSISTNLNISGGTFTVEIAEDWCAAGYIPQANDDGTYGVKIGTYVAEVGGVKFESLAEAVAAAQDGDTVTLLISATGAGVVIDKSITIDLNGKTYTVNKCIGSAGTQTLGFQILNGNDVTIKNGALAATTVTEGKPVKVLVQNYANLTLTDVTLDGTGSAEMQYVLSNNSGSVNITGATDIVAPEGAVAFDVYDYSSAGYTVPVVNVNTTGTITGKIKVSDSISTNLNISGGTFTVDVTEYCKEGHHTVDTDNDGKYTYGAHAYGTGWVCDDANHWHECACGAIEGKAAHVYTDGKCECGAIWIIVRVRGNVSYTVNGQTVTVTHDTPCRVGYCDEASQKYVAITAVANDDDSYSFTAPAGITVVQIVIVGDTNGDERITAADVARLNAYLQNKKTDLSAEDLFAADVNGDGLVDDTDKMYLSNAILGKKTLDWNIVKGVQ